ARGAGEVAEEREHRRLAGHDAEIGALPAQALLLGVVQRALPAVGGAQLALERLEPRAGLLLLRLGLGQLAAQRLGRAQAVPRRLEVLLERLHRRLAANQHLADAGDLALQVTQAM